MSSPPSSIPLSSHRLTSHHCAHHTRSCVATTGLLFRRRMPSPVSPLASLPLTFSNYPCLSILGWQRRRVYILSGFACVDTFMQIAESPRLSSQVSSSLENITHFLTHNFPTSSGRFFTNICHSVRIDQDEETCFTSTVSEIPKSETVMLSFAAGGREEFVSALTKQGTFLSEDFGPIKYIVENQEQEASAVMKSGRWVVYAARTLVVRFWDLTKVSLSPVFCGHHFTPVFSPESG